jgi:hypothetical protein
VRDLLSDDILLSPAQEITGGVCETWKRQKKCSGRMIEALHDENLLIVVGVVLSDRSAMGHCG